MALCDVAGHGIGPALLATRFSSEVRRGVLDQLSPADLVKQLNEFLVRNFSGTELFVTFLIAQFEFPHQSLTYCGAGHPGPLLIRGGSRQVDVLDSQNPPIGTQEECLAERASEQVDVGPGDRLIFFTDGLTETMDANGNMFGVEGVVRFATITCAGGLFDAADCFLERLDAYRKGPPPSCMHYRLRSAAESPRCGRGGPRGRGPDRKAL